MRILYSLQAWRDCVNNSPAFISLFISAVYVIQIDKMIMPKW